jgi:hypothetical protein
MTKRIKKSNVEKENKNWKKLKVLKKSVMKFHPSSAVRKLLAPGLFSIHE